MKIWLLKLFLLEGWLAVAYGQANLFTYPDPTGITKVYLDENVPMATSVLTVQTKNAGDSIRNLQVSDFPQTTILTGVLSLTGTKNLITASNLDYETIQAYMVVLEAVDNNNNNGNSPQQTSTVTFYLLVNDVNEETPVITVTTNTVTMKEERATGTTVPFVFSVTDGDAGDTFTYSLSGLHSAYFSIDSSTGGIVVNQKLDIDAVGAITTFDQLTLHVKDAGGHTATASLSVTLTDINDNAPYCSPNLYAVSIDENTPSGTSVSAVFCKDADVTSANSGMTYSIFTGDDSTNKFSLSSATVMTTSNKLDYETKSTYVLILYVTDTGSPALTGTTTVLVTVVGVNEATPVMGVFTPAGSTYILSESVGLGTSVFTMTATDSDEGPDGEIEYILVSTSGNGSPVSGIFTLDISRGQLSTATTFDYESGVTNYVLQVEAKDKGNPVKSATANLTVSITDVNDNTPAFSLTSYSATVKESDALAGFSVRQLTATDADTTKGTLLYQITSGDSLNKFRFSSVTSGLLELNSNVEVDDPTNDPAYYILLVQVSDNGIPNTPARTGTSSVTVTILPVNDYIPVFGTPTPSASPSIAEDVSIGTSVATISVTDADNDYGVSQTVTLTIANGNTNSAFNIDSTTGVISTAKALDYETTTSYALVIQATDNGTPINTSSMTLTITITNVNDNAPKCPSSFLYATVPENAVNQQLATLSCSDSDIGDSITYSIVPADASFTVGATSGIVTNILGLNYESTSTHTLTIHVTDSLTVVKTSTVTLSVSVQPVNEYPPVFAPVTYTLTLAENVAAGTSVVTVTATDQDQGALDGTIRFSIVSGNGDGAFTIDSTSGKVETTAIGLDYERTITYTLIVTAKDDVPGSINEHNTNCTVIITVTDVNDNAPLCIQPLPIQIVEPSVIGAVITTVTSRDDDESGTPNATPTYSIIAGDANSIFNFFGAQLMLAKVVDYETQSSYSLTIRVSDSGTPSPLSSTCLVYVTIISADEFPPVMTVPNYSSTLAETAAIGTTVYQASSTDGDTGTGSTFTYSITSGNTNGDFFCYPDTGIIIVWNSLDYDTPPQAYNLTVTSTDDGGKNGSMWLYVSLLDSNDQTPVFTNNVYAIKVQENVANGTSVGAVTATDSDTGANGTVTYTVVSGDGMTRFSVNSATGVITTIANIDREVRGRYSLVVRASDGGTPSLSSTSLVDINIADLNDNAPVFTPTDFTVSLSEDVSVGTTVTTVYAVDVDSAVSNNVFSYVLTNSYFQVDATTGVITTKATLDRETKGRHVLTILAPDSGSPSLTGTATVTVIVDDVNDNYPIIVGTYALTIAESVAVGTVVTTINTTDADKGDNARITYTVVSGNTDNDFYLSSSGGTIQVRNTLDRERTALYTLVIMAADNGVPVLSSTTTVTFTISDINDNSPVWASSSYAFSVFENQAAGTIVGQVLATDVDLGTNAVVTYTVVLFWTGNSAHFNLDPSTGVITTMVVLDCETTPQYKAILRATDGGSPALSTDVNVTINVGDLNDNKPVFSTIYYTASTPENKPVGTSVLALAVTDADSGTSGTVTLTIDTSTTSGARAALFLDLASGTGLISVKSVIDYDVDKSFSFNVLAVDGGTPALSSSANVTITITDQNDHAPIFTKTYYNTEVAYSGQCAASIITVTATDADTGVNGEVYYYEDQNTYSSLFNVHSTSGVFSLSKTLTANLMYTQYVLARDGGSPSLTSTTPVTIRVDAMVPDNVVITFHLGITPAAFKAQQTAFLAECQAMVRQSYPSALVRLWCVETSSEGLADVHVYFLQDDSTESVANSSAAKYYVSDITARSFFTQSIDGTPSADLSGSKWSPYNVKTVSPYYESQTPWAKTSAGIVIITLCALVGAGLLALATYMGIKYSRMLNRARPPIRKIKGNDNPQRRIERPKEKGQPPRPQHDWDDSFFWDRSAQFL